jgi:1-acyl-sn-glycerol-3-phosphate acyltransferase
VIWDQVTTHHGSRLRDLAAAAGRRVLWRVVLALTGGLHAVGDLPPGPCVIVANHSSHADTGALLAAIPVHRRPVAAAAADYWFRRPGRARLCRTLCAAFPVRRGEGGRTDLAAAAVFLVAGHDVIVFPEGTRSRNGELGQFRTGAARLAQSANAPLVPVRIEGTRELLPVGGGLRRSPVTVRFGAPVDTAGSDDVSEHIDLARAAVLKLGEDVAHRAGDGGASGCWRRGGGRKLAIVHPGE